MLFLHFQIGDGNFALSIDRVVEVLPMVELNKERDAPAWIVGSFDYRGRFVPVADLCALELGRPARQRLSTRIVMVRLGTDEDALLGLIAENAIETLRREPSDFAPFATGPRGLVQRVELESLLPAGLQAYVCGDRVACP
jgi:chemotaxis-related protein WspB